MRGFGARSTFGIRGVRLYVDGIPATLPDGQGQITNVDLGSAERIEVLRGPFSALYGNSSGGVIQVFTEEGSGAPRLWRRPRRGQLRHPARRRQGERRDRQLRLRRQRAASSTPTATATTARPSGSIGNAKLTWRPDDASKLDASSSTASPCPRPQDPLGLTRAQFDADPRSVDPVGDRRSTPRQDRRPDASSALIYERRLDAVNSLRALIYGGHRNTEQFQAIPVAPQAQPAAPRRRDRRSAATTAAATCAGPRRRRLGDAPLDGRRRPRPTTRWTEQRRGYQNFIGTTLGVQGALRRDERNDVTGTSTSTCRRRWQCRRALDAQRRRAPQRAFSFDSERPLRRRHQPRRQRQRRAIGATLPVLGVMFAASDAASTSTPPPAAASRRRRSNELRLPAERRRPASTSTLRRGAQQEPRGRREVRASRPAATSTVAVFETHTDNEIATLSNVGGRSTFQNAGATRRRGVERRLERRAREDLRAQARLHLARRALPRRVPRPAPATPCAAPNLTIPAGNHDPRPRPSAVLRARSPGRRRSAGAAALEVRALSRVCVNDAQLRRRRGLRDVRRATSATWRGSARFDAQRLRAASTTCSTARYAGSVIVNEGNARYFEPSPARNWTVGVAATTRLLARRARRRDALERRRGDAERRCRSRR